MEHWIVFKMVSSHLPCPVIEIKANDVDAFF